MVSRCNCCSSPKSETIQHVFMEEEAASYIWKLIGSLLGLTHHQRSVRFTINNWWQVKALNDVHKLLLQITPSIIYWTIWKERCSCKYGNQKKFNLFKMGQHNLLDSRSSYIKSLSELQALFPGIISVTT